MSNQQPGSASLHNEDRPWWLRLCRWLWSHPLPFLWSALLINIAINIGSTWLITPAKTPIIPATSILGNITGWVSAHWVFSLFLGTITVALLLLSWFASHWPEAIPSGHDQQPMSSHDRDYLLKRLRLRYEQGIAQSLQGTVQIDLAMASRPAAIHNAASLSLRLPEQSEQLLSPQTTIIDAYEQAQQELLILGEPGAGKSTLLLELAHHLVEQAEQEITHPLPVLLPLSSWAVRRPPLHEWIIEQFALLYAISQKRSRQWVEAELLLPLLDGLDEMDEAVRPACITEINIYHRDHLHPLVVCSRTNEYDTAALHERLALHTAVVVQPLSPEQIDIHLTTIGKPLAGLRAALRKNATLQTLATTPLLLQILMLTYHGISVRALSQKEIQLQEQIWTDYVQRMVSRKGDVKRYPLEQTCAWLSWLAREMRLHNQTIFSLEQLRPSWLPKRQKILYQWSTRLLIGLLVGWFVELVSGLLSGLIWGLVAGLFLGVVFGSDEMIQPIEVVTWSWEELRDKRISGLVAGLFFGLLVGAGSGERAGPIWGLVAGLVTGLFLGLIAGLSNKQITERHMLSPNEGIQRSMKNGLLDVLGGVLLIVLLTMLLSSVPSRVLHSGLSFVPLFVLLLMLRSGLAAAIQHYLLRFWLWRSHLFPLKAIPFLEDATARIFLRRIGGGYSFTHRLLLDYFADLNRSTSSSVNIVPSTQQPTQP